MNPILLAAHQYKVAVVVLNYNGVKMLERFLPALIDHLPTYATLIIADNASTDQSINFLKGNYPHIEVISIPSNLGYAGGYNYALSKIDAEYFALVNSDIEVKMDWIEPIIAFFEKNQNVAAVQPKIKSIRQPNLFEYAGAAGGWMDRLGYPFCRGRIFDHAEQDLGQYDTTAEIFLSSGACFVIKSKVFHEAGGFDESYFAHMEEIDLCWRIHRLGYQIFCLPKSTVFHLGAGTLDYESPFKTYLNFRNNLSTLQKNEPFAKRLWLIPLRLILDGVAGAKFLLGGQWRNCLAVIKAHFGFYARINKNRKRKLAFNAKLNRSKTSIKPSGRSNRTIIIEYFLKGKKTFSEIIK